MKIRSLDIALLVIRIALAAVFIAHGGQKLFGWFGGGGMTPVVGMTTKMGFPLPAFWAYLLAITEFFGGLSVLGGLLARLGALGIMISQLVAVAKIHIHNGFFTTTHGFEFNQCLIAIALAIVLAGPGLISLDAALHLWITRRKSRAQAVTKTEPVQTQDNKV